MRKSNLKQIFFFLLTFTASFLLSLALISCQEETNDSKSKAPVLSILPGHQSLICIWTDSDPVTENFILFYLEGVTDDAERIKIAGKVVSGAVSPFTITGLDRTKTYSVVVTAETDDFIDIDSAVKHGQPFSASSKRGVSYTFTTDNGASQPDDYTPTTYTERDMLLLKHGITWFYTWGPDLARIVDNSAKTHDLTFYPMAWTSGWNDQKISAYFQANPECEYILSYNEPNLEDQANMTPTEAAEDWPNILNIAKSFNPAKKIVAPAMNYGTLANYFDPIKWLNEFYALPGVSWNDVEALSVHCYMAYPSAVKSYIGRYRTELKNQAGQTVIKPIWMTEFCAWDDYPNRDSNPAPDHQMYYLSQIVTYMELEPAVEKYAWFIPKAGNWDWNDFPYHSFIKKTNPPELTPLGQIYVYMSTCDKSVWMPAGAVIPAKDFNDCNISDDIGKWETWNDTVTYRPTTDPAASALLDVLNFASSKWVEYQVDAPETKEYTLTLRFQTTGNSGLYIKVDNTAEKTKAINSAAWNTTTVDLGTISAGKHTIRLRSTGNLALNWLKID